MLKRFLFLLGLLALISTVIVLWTGGLGIKLFHSAQWLFLGAIIVGTVAAIIGALIKSSSTARKVNGNPERHSVDSTMQHWGTAVGIFILMISGFQIGLQRGFSGTNLHFLGLFLTLLFGTYFTTDFLVSRKAEILLPDSKDIIDGTLKKYLLHKKTKEIGKYLASQKSAFLAFAIIGGQIMISGVIKLLPFYMSVPVLLVKAATQVHDISAVLFVMILTVHVFLVLTNRENRVLLRSWFTGRIPEKSQQEVAESANIQTDETGAKDLEVIPENSTNFIDSQAMPMELTETADVKVIISEPGLDEDIKITQEHGQMQFLTLVHRNNIEESIVLEKPSEQEIND
jgi:cytochrome b subunit of formate dehydrogenase